MEALNVIGVERAKCGLTQPHCLFQHRVEHRREIAGLGVDDLQHFCGRGLLLQRLPLFGDQPSVLDRDHRLIGEGADKFDLPIGERFDPLAAECEDTNRCRLPAAAGHLEEVRTLPRLATCRMAYSGSVGHIANLH